VSVVGVEEMDVNGKWVIYRTRQHISFLSHLYIPPVIHSQLHRPAKDANIRQHPDTFLVIVLLHLSPSANTLT
jgi:hypothetical protein